MKRTTRLYWESLERWSPTAFLVAGGLLLASPATKVLALFADVSLPTWLVVAYVFPGLLASTVGLLGIYPALTDRTPRLALAGGMVAAFAGSVTVVTFGWVLTVTVSAVIPGVAVTGSPDMVFISLMAATAVSFILFGLACLRSTVLGRLVGVLLLGFAAPWVVLLGAAPVYGSDFPVWLTLSAYGTMPVALLATGYVLRDGFTTARRDTSSTGLAAE